MKRLSLTLLLSVFGAVSVYAQEAEATLNTGDTAWLLIATALVMLMTPAGLALFYGGLTQNKHVLNTIGMSYMAFCTGSLIWIIGGYSLAFSDGNAIIGGLSNFMLHGIGVNDVSGSIMVGWQIEPAFIGDGPIAVAAPQWPHRLGCVALQALLWPHRPGRTALAASP